MLVAPSHTWHEISGRAHWLPAVIAQIVILAISGLLAFDSLSDIAESAGLGLSGSAGPFSFIASAFQISLSVLLVNCLLALLLFALIKILGSRHGFSVALTWTSFGLMPEVLGYLYSSIQLAIVRPLSDNLALNLSWLIKPYSLGLASILPDSIPPLSFTWFATSYLDLFGIWSLACLAIGARHYLNYSIFRTLWITLGLMLISILVVTGMWQFTQQVLIMAAR